jgi:hypothetical protein
MEPHYYVVGFSDAQTLQGTRRRLFTAIEAVDRALDIITGIKKHCPNYQMPAQCLQAWNKKASSSSFSTDSRTIGETWSLWGISNRAQVLW